LAVAGWRLATRWRLARRHVEPHEPASDATSSVPAFKRWRNRLVASSILFLLVGYGAWLRLDAITAHYGPVTQPAWLAHLQTRALAADSWRPASFVWDPAPTFPHRDGVSTRYRSDPYTYIQYAREMRTFYWAHYREPVFPFVTKVALHLLANQDVAVSFASAFFSALAIVITYLLGASIGSRLVGLLAASAFAIDYDFVSLSSEGWRDDAYIAAVGLTVWMLLRLWRQTNGVARRARLGPWSIDVAYRTAVAFGVVAGLTILVRLMAASFVFPALGILIFAMRRPWRARVAIVTVALLATIVTAGPYFFSCWRVYGDPLYSFNVHGHFYRLAEGMADSESGTASYVIAKLRSHPFDMADTVLRGLTVYPFTNKWLGLERWHESLGTDVSIAALAGIPILAATSPGRWVLFVLLTSVVPFAFTWKVDPSLRFTAFTYPLYLIAAATTAVSTCRLVYLLFTDPDRARRRTPIRRSTILAVVSLGAAVLAVTWVLVHLLPPRIGEERLRNGEETTVFAAHDATGAFFGPGWSAVTGTGNVQARVVARSADVFLRLPRAADYPLTMRLDPFPRPLNDSPAHLPRVELRLNGTPLATTLLRWTPDRVGAYDIVLPQAATHAGKNVLTFLVRHAFDATPLARPGLSEGDAVAVWYVRVHAPVAMQSE
jgi:4-amino-4-deoxy-L-arabinose transferase-like glycosyltransferase